MSVVRPIRFPGIFDQTSIAGLYGRRPVVSEGVPSGGGVSISSYGVPYLLALHRAWNLSKRIICHQQNSAGKK
jgi:hypothetical protein